MPHRAGTPQLAAALLAHANGSARVGTERLADAHNTGKDVCDVCVCQLTAAYAQHQPHGQVIFSLFFLSCVLIILRSFLLQVAVHALDADFDGALDAGFDAALDECAF